MALTKHPHPCNLNRAGSANIAAAVADGTPAHPRWMEPCPQLGRPSAVPSNPNSRLGRAKRSPLRQGRDMMDAVYVGIDVSKDRLDVHALPQGAAFIGARNGGGVAQVVARLKGHAL